MRRRIIATVSVVLAAAAGTAAVVLGPYLVRVQRFRADPAAGYHADFFLYTSPAAKRAAAAGTPATLLIQPNNLGTTSDDPGVHRRDAWWTGYGRHVIADELGVVLLVPAFVRPSSDWRIYTHALDRDALTTDRIDLARIDLQLIAMIDRARDDLARRGVATEERVLIQGFSASGMFANRFAALHPTRVRAVAVGSPGGWPIAPVAFAGADTLDYPAGVADLEALTGAPFDSVAFVQIPQLFVMGSLDDNDSLDFGDGWDKEAASRVDRLFGSDPMARWNDAEALYRAVGANAQFMLVDGVGHNRRDVQGVMTGFLAGVLAR